MTKAKTIRVKEWLVNKIDSEAHAYKMGIDINTDREAFTTAQADEDGCLNVYVTEVLQESEKAVKVRLMATKLNRSMSAATWDAWIAKSQIVEF